MERKKNVEPTSLLLPSLLADRDLHGYQMITELERRSDQTFHMKEGTLYPVLKKLENAGAVTSYEADANGRTRKYYHITRSGLKHLAEEKEAWGRYAHGVNSVLGFVTG